ncbi:hypothetical protein [Wenjunlia vitaminophila]|uniref:hypothetical protein n=1 Tax=Wenjunlia vitaminophila TaxID=76728 RepID=UPI0003A81117|nr:hypothetical protein [Wenjunlia vitaminophila]
MTETGSGETVRVSLDEDRVALDAAKLCGARFVPVASAPLPGHIVVFRPWKIGRYGGISCTEAQRVRWQAAARRYLDAVSRALEELHRAHGGRRASVDLYHRVRSWATPGEPFPWPGRRRRTAARSARAQQVFLERLEHAAQEYRPVREEIEALVAAHRAEQQAVQEERRRAAERLRQVVRTVASHRHWVHAPSRSGRTVNIGISPEAPSEPAPPRLTAYELEESLLELWRSTSPRPRFAWDPDACAEVERECRDLGEPMAFSTWWNQVTRHTWRTTPSGPTPAPPPTRPSFGGTGSLGSGGYIGGFGTSF